MIKGKRIGIDIGTHTIKIVVGSQRSKSLLIHNAYTCPTPFESYNDGYIQKPDALRQAIQDVLLGNHIRTKRVMFTIQSSAAIIREIILPYAKRAKELQSMLSFEIEQHLPVNLEEYIIEHKVSEELIENGIKKIKILIAALPQIIVEDYLRLAKLLNLCPIALNIHSDTVAKLFETEQHINNRLYQPHEIVSLISLGHEQIHITIIEKGLLKLQWLISRGGKDINPYICKSSRTAQIEFQDKKKNCTYSEGFHADETSNSSLMVEWIQSMIDRWIQEIQMVFQYYMGRTEKHRLDAIYIYGGSSNLSDLAQAMETRFNIPTFQIKTIDTIDFSQNVQEKNLSIYLPAIAALLKK